MNEYLEAAAESLYRAGQVRQPRPLPPYESDDAREMRADCRYRILGAHKRGDAKARLVAVERIAIVLATLNGDIWPDCDNQIHQGLSVERRAVLAAMRRQRYRHQAGRVCAEVAKFYEIDDHTDAELSLWIDTAQARREADTKIMSAYRGRIGRGEVMAMGGGA